MRRVVRTFVTMLCASVVCGGMVAASRTIELTRDLAASDVCPTEERCWSRERSVQLHRDETDPDSVRLPTGSSSSVYVHVHDDGGEPRLELDYLAVGTELVLRARSDAGPDLVLYRGAATGGRWQHLVLDLASWRGHIAQLRFRPEPVDDTDDRRCAIRRMELRNAEPHPRATLSERSPDPPPNVILYVIDTLRADRLGCYGYRRPTSPRIDAFARSALLFRDAVAQSSWTLPATASLLTGRTPPNHGALDVGTSLRPDVVTLAERLQAHGYRTAGFVTNSLASRSYGFDRGFGEFRVYAEKPRERSTTYLPARVLHRRVRRWLERNVSRAPFLLYVHATDPHWPYLPAPRHARPFQKPGETPDDERAAVRAAWPYFFGNEHHGERPTTMPPDRVALLSDLYDGEVRAADEAFGWLLDDLTRLGALDHTAVILTSDHGEEFLDHDGLGHGQTLHDEVLHVPFLIRLPAGARGGEQVQRAVQQIDVVPTILDLVGAASGEDLEGRSVLNGVDDEGEIASHIDHLGVRFDSLTTSHWKAIRDLGAVTARAPIAVYDRVADRAERHDQASQRPAVVGYARQRLRRAAAALVRGPQVDTAVLARLRALGYVHE